MLQSTSISQKGAFIGIWHPDFCGYHPGKYLLTEWLWRLRELAFLVPRDSKGATQKEVYTPVWHPYIVTAARGHLYIAWLLWPVGLTFVGPTGLQPMEKVFLNSNHPKAQQETIETGLSVKQAN